MAVSSLAARAAAATLLVLATLPALAQSPTRTRLVTQSPSPAGEPVTMTAEVDALGGGAPRGSVSFTDGETVLGSVALFVPGAGQATLAAGSHTCALASNGGLKCWGYNIFGQLGDGTQTHRRTPGWVAGLTTGVVAVATGQLHSCALTDVGAVKCWGNNQYGQLGDRTTINHATPTPVFGLSGGVVAIAAGAFHNCALTTGGRVKCWGEGSGGQLGYGLLYARSSPVDLHDSSTFFTALAAGGSHSCGVTTGRGIKCWGNNSLGQVGDGGTGAPRAVPVPVPGLSASAVTAGEHHTCAVTMGGGIKCWGRNFRGALGDGTKLDRRTPTQVLGMESGVAAVSAGSWHSCALLISGKISCWGDNSMGQVGDGSAVERDGPTPLSNLAGFAVSLSSGGHSNCALLSPSRTMRCWGYNEFGQLGDGTNTDRFLPRSTVNFWGVLRGRARLAATLAAGSHPLRTYFPGDAAHAPSVSPIVTHTVQ